MTPTELTTPSPNLEYDDPQYIEKGVETVLQEQKSNPSFQVSLSFLQRRLRWGYHRASRLLPEIARLAAIKGSTEPTTPAETPNESRTPRNYKNPLQRAEERPDQVMLETGLSAQHPMLNDWARIQFALKDLARANAENAATQKLRNALEAVLLFHSGSPWDAEKKGKWWNLTQTNEATTRTLCDNARLALGRLPSCFSDFMGKLPTDLPSDLPLTHEQKNALICLERTF